MEASFDQSYTVLRKSRYLQNKGTSVWNFFLASGLLHGISIAEHAINLARHGGRWQRDKLDRRRSTKLTVPPSSDARPLSYHSDRQALSTQQDSVVRVN